MTTYIDFTPQVTSPPFQFSPILDGQAYNAVVTWPVYSQRWYVTISDLSGNVIVYLPVIGSPLNYNISLTAGYFTTQLVFRQANNQFEVI